MEICNMSVEFPKGGISIDRKTPLGNPFIRKIHGSREVVVAKYRIYLYKKLVSRDPVIEEAFRKLNKDSKIVCHCHPELCHGDVIKAFHEIISFGDTYDVGVELLRRTKIPLIGIDPREDGMSHVNTYSKAQTRLGQMLSNFYRSPFGLKGHGYFQSVEGFWYYLSTGCKEEKFKDLWGHEAKELGRSLERIEMEPEEFKEKIKLAVCAKLFSNKEILIPFLQSSAPFKHYYWYGDSIENPHVVLCPEVDWLMDYLNDLRKEMKESTFLPEEFLIAGLHGLSWEDIKLSPEDIPF